MGKPVTDARSTRTYTNEFIELIGWAVTEGNYTLGIKTHSVQIFQKEGIAADKIRCLLNKLNARYKEYVWCKKTNVIGWRITKDIANEIIKLAPNKILSENFIVSLTQSQRMLLIKTMIDGDGWIRNDNEGTPWSYTQKDKKHIDSFIMLCTLSGLTTSTHLRLNESKFTTTKSWYYIVNIYSSPKLTCKFENVNLHGGRSTAGGKQGKKYNPNIPTTYYTGVVWCPRTEFGTFIARRKGQVYITGNTYKEEMIGDAVEKMIKALWNQKYDPEKGNPFSYFTQISFNAFCNRIKKEKRNREAICGYQIEVYEALIHTGNITDEPIEESTETTGEDDEH
jgi:hypothetical protein